MSQMNINKRRTLLALILCLTLTTVVTPVYGAQSEELIDKKADIILFMQTLDYIKSKYPFEIENRELITNGIKGMLQGLDEYSDYYTKEEAEQFMKKVSGDYAGIGVYIEKKGNYIGVINAIEGSPGEKAGLKPGDLIISVDGKIIKGVTLEEVSHLIQGPKGTKVKLTIMREGTANPIQLDITRDNIKINPVKYEILENQIGYIKLSEFNHYATTYMKEALKEFDKKGIKKVIVDVRNNPGGLLNESVGVTELFVPKGPIVHIRNKGKIGTTYVSTLEKPKYELVVLVNSNSASASEIFAGAVKDRKAGTIVGTITYGKGLVQGVANLSDGSLIKMTIAEYLTPNKTSIHNKGVEPDIMVINSKDEDLQLKKAIEILKK